MFLFFLPGQSQKFAPKSGEVFKMQQDNTSSTKDQKFLLTKFGLFFFLVEDGLFKTIDEQNFENVLYYNCKVDTTL